MSWGTFCPRPCWVNRDMNSWQIKLGSFWENRNAASRALSIKGAEGGSGGLVTESADSDSACGGSGQGGRSGCPLFFKVGTSEQGGVLGAGDWALAGGVAKASAKATMTPAMRSQRRVRRRLCPFTDSPCFESSTMLQSPVASGQSPVKIKKKTRDFRFLFCFTVLKAHALPGWDSKSRVRWYPPPLPSCVFRYLRGVFGTALGK